MPKLIKSLPSGNYDIVGDVHGELPHLISLMEQLGYTIDGYHPQGRMLLFVGDLCDRGPDSIAVIRLVKRLMELGRAFAVLGNHELNVLTDANKDGSGWISPARHHKDTKYEPYAKCTESDKAEILEFLGSLPVVAENSELRAVHAAWDLDAIAEIRAIGEISSYAEFYESKDSSFLSSIPESLLREYHAEKSKYADMLDNPSKKNPPPFLPATCEYYRLRQKFNPIRVVTSGTEAPTATPFIAGGEWRFVSRTAWWNTYSETIPVIIGHYWRKLNPKDWNLTPDYLFSDVHPLSWHGYSNLVFCVDYSAGAGFMDRRENNPVGHKSKLAALRFTENELMFSSGDRYPILK